MTIDPTTTNPEKYSVVFENEHVRVLDYKDSPGDKTSPHEHPNSVMVTLSSFGRTLIFDDKEVQVEMESGKASWLPAQEHAGFNTGQTDTHVIFVELKNP